MSAQSPTADVREGGRWTLGQRIKNDVLYAIAVGALAVVTRVPRSVARLAGRVVAAFAWLALPRMRGLAERNVARVFPEMARSEARAFVRRVYRTLGPRLGDAVASLRDAPPPLPFTEGSRDCLQSAINEAQENRTGVVFASAHLGPWEEVASSLVAHGVPLTVVAREPYDPRFAKVYARLRRDVRTVYRGQDHAPTALVRALRRGDVLGIPMDLASRVPSVSVPFLGHPARTAVGPARLAIRTGAAVVVGAATPEGLFFQRIERCDDEIELTRRINEALSERIRAWPEAWLWMHDRWA